MVIVSLVFLFVYLFGAYAYGAAMLFGLRDVGPVWTHGRDTVLPGQRRIDAATMALFVISTVWFVLHAVIEFRDLTTGDARQGWLDLATFIVFFFPPVIMHTTYLESEAAHEETPPLLYRTLLRAMYVVSPAAGLYLIGAIFKLLPSPADLGPFIGITIGGLFTLTSIYCTVLMLRRPQRPARSADQIRLRNVMIFLFIMLSGVFIALIFMEESSLLVAILGRVTRSSPIFFLVASVYFENRFVFYDLVVKRATLLLASMLVLGLYVSLTLPWLSQVPAGAARPWLWAVALAPVPMVMRPLVAWLEAWLDRMWLGREFTPVDAVKHVLAAMQPATDEASLVRATEARLSEIFRSRIAVLTGSETAGEAAIELEVAMPTPLSGEPVRIAVVKAPGMRRILSEDLAMLRSLASVFGFMLENIRLQRRRQEQDQLAHDLRLQSSRSELKALRAQINPHFLFNALNAIASLIHTDPGRADEAVEQLAEVFRYTLRRSESEWAPLDQELAFARAYLDVEQARFGQRLTYSIDSDHHVPVPHVPSMLIQTLLENAVKHGVSQVREPGRIDVIARTTPDRITIEVRNTGPSTLDPSTRSGHSGEGFGLHSVRERLKGHFGDRASFRLFRDETAGVTIARVDMPQAKVAA
jgi:hypothetical protein